MNTHPAICPDALRRKASKYLSRALSAKSDGDRELYLFWACLSLEILAKRALAIIHPSLIVDSSRDASALAAVGKYHGDDIRTISCDAAFRRLRDIISKKHHAKISTVGVMISKRNAELHSGDEAMKCFPKHWEGFFWQAAHTILDLHGEELESYLKRECKEYRDDFNIALHIEEAKARSYTRIQIDSWKGLPQAAKNKRLASSEGMSKEAVLNFHRRPQGGYQVGAYEFGKCPICTFTRAVWGGELYEGKTDSSIIGTVEASHTPIMFMPGEFFCPCCEVFCAETDDAGNFDEFQLLPDSFKVGWKVP